MGWYGKGIAKGIISWKQRGHHVGCPGLLLGLMIKVRAWHLLSFRVGGDFWQSRQDTRIWIGNSNGIDRSFGKPRFVEFTLTSLAVGKPMALSTITITGITSQPLSIMRRWHDYARVVCY
jgi:hypothetical protein